MNGTNIRDIPLVSGGEGSTTSALPQRSLYECCEVVGGYEYSIQAQLTAQAHLF